MDYNVPVSGKSGRLIMAQFSQADLGPHRSTNLVIKPRYIKRDFTSPWIDSFILSGVAVILGYRYIPIFEKKDAV